MTAKNNQKKKQTQNQPQNQNKKNDKKKSKKSSSSSSSSYWISAIFVVLFAIGGALYYDTYYMHNGKFETTTVGKVLKDTGALPYVETAWLGTLKVSARGYKWSEKNVPVYYNTTVTVLKPYLEVARDLSKIALNGGKNAWTATVAYIETKRPTVTKFIEQYAPGLPEKLSNICSSTWTNIKTLTINTYTFGVEFFKTKVFVGTLSPESLEKLYNSTQKSIDSYRVRFLRNVEYYSNLK